MLGSYWDHSIPKKRISLEEIELAETLKIVKFHRVVISHRDLFDISERLERNKNVRVLNLRTNCLDIWSESPLSKIIEETQTICEFRVSNNVDVFANGSKSFFKVLAHNKSITTLDLNEMNLGIAGAKALAYVLRKNETLRQVNFCYNEIGDEGAKVLAEVLKQNKTLRQLELVYNDFGDIGTCAIAEALKQNNSLTSLNISYNSEITVVGWHAMIDALQYNTSMIGLDFVTCEIYDLDCHDEVCAGFSKIHERNLNLQRKMTEEKAIQCIFVGLFDVFGCDVYINLLIIDRIPWWWCPQLNRAHIVAFLQSLADNSKFISDVKVDTSDNRVTLKRHVDDCSNVTKKRRVPHESQQQ